MRCLVPFSAEQQESRATVFAIAIFPPFPRTQPMKLRSDFAVLSTAQTVETLQERGLCTE
jgi:hypothetical protein